MFRIVGKILLFVGIIGAIFVNVTHSHEEFHGVFSKVIFFGALCYMLSVPDCLISFLSLFSKH